MQEQPRYYELNGVRVPRVSTILSRFYPFEFTSAGADYKAHLGTQIHQAILLYDENRLDLDSTDELLLSYVATWNRFKVLRGFAVLKSEILKVSEKMGFGGKADKLAIDCKGRNRIIEIKTGAMRSPRDFLQVGAYYELMRPRANRKGVIVYFTPDGEDFRVVEFDAALAGSVFRGLAAAYNYEEKGRT